MKKSEKQFLIQAQPINTIFEQEELIYFHWFKFQNGNIAQESFHLEHDYGHERLMQIVVHLTGYTRMGNRKVLLLEKTEYFGLKQDSRQLPILKSKIEVNFEMQDPTCEV